ncbi:MAG: hypothetical protein ACK5SX_11235 [Sandaracinobacter sp.]
MPQLAAGFLTAEFLFFGGIDPSGRIGGRHCLRSLDGSRGRLRLAGAKLRLKRFQDAWIYGLSQNRLGHEDRQKGKHSGPVR